MANIQGVLELFPQAEECGMAHISHIEFDNDKDPLFNLRALRDGGSMFVIHNGKYVRLHVNGELVMSDTDMERKSNQPFIERAHGNVLIAGLGIGLVLKNILDKPSVTSVTVIEKHADVIKLVEPKFKHPKLTIVCDDIFVWRPVKGSKYNVIYFDIWSEICTDNLTEITQLHNAFKSYVDRTDPAHYMNSWMKEFLQAENRKRW